MIVVLLLAYMVISRIETLCALSICNFTELHTKIIKIDGADFAENPYLSN